MIFLFCGCLCFVDVHSFGHLSSRKMYEYFNALTAVRRENIWKQAQMDTIQFMKTMTLEVLVHDMQEEDMFINSADLICHISIQVYLFIMLHFIVLHRYCFFVVIGGGGVVFTN